MGRSLQVLFMAFFVIVCSFTGSPAVQEANAEAIRFNVINKESNSNVEYIRAISIGISQRKENSSIPLDSKRMNGIAVKRGMNEQITLNYNKGEVSLFGPKQVNHILIRMQIQYATPQLGCKVFPFDFSIKGPQAGLSAYTILILDNGTYFPKVVVPELAMIIDRPGHGVKCN